MTEPIDRPPREIDCRYGGYAESEPTPSGFVAVCRFGPMEMVDPDWILTHPPEAPAPSLWRSVLQWLRGA